VVTCHIIAHNCTLARLTQIEEPFKDFVTGDALESPVVRLIDGRCEFTIDIDTVSL
jgi:hypothetical protein